MYVYLIYKIILIKLTTMTTWWRQLGGCRFIVKAVHCWSRRCGNVASWQREPALLSAACTHTHAYTYHNTYSLTAARDNVEDLPRGCCSAVASGPAMSPPQQVVIWLLLSLLLLSLSLYPRCVGILWFSLYVHYCRRRGRR